MDSACRRRSLVENRIDFAGGENGVIPVYKSLMNAFSSRSQKSSHQCYNEALSTAELNLGPHVCTLTNFSWILSPDERPCLYLRQVFPPDQTLEHFENPEHGSSDLKERQVSRSMTYRAGVRRLTYIYLKIVVHFFDAT